LCWGSSELLGLHAVDEEDESGVSLVLLVVADADIAFHIVALTAEELHLVDLAHDELDTLGGALLELGSSFGFADLLEVSNNLGQVALGPCGEVLLGEGDLVKLEGVHDVNDGLCVFIIVRLFVGGDLDLNVTLLDHLGLNLEASIVVDLYGLVGVRDHLITGDHVFVNNNHSEVATI